MVSFKYRPSGESTTSTPTTPNWLNRKMTPSQKARNNEEMARSLDEGIREILEMLGTEDGREHLQNELHKLRGVVKATKDQKEVEKCKSTTGMPPTTRNWCNTMTIICSVVCQLGSAVLELAPIPGIAVPLNLVHIGFEKTRIARNNEELACILDEKIRKVLEILETDDGRGHLKNTLHKLDGELKDIKDLNKVEKWFAAEATEKNLIHLEHRFSIDMSFNAFVNSMDTIAADKTADGQLLKQATRASTMLSGNTPSSETSTDDPYKDDFKVLECSDIHPLSSDPVKSDQSGTITECKCTIKGDDTERILVAYTQDARSEWEKELESQRKQHWCQDPNRVVYGYCSNKLAIVYYSLVCKDSDPPPMHKDIVSDIQPQMPTRTSDDPKWMVAFFILIAALMLKELRMQYLDYLFRQYSSEII